MNAITTPHKTLFISYSRKQSDWCNELYRALDNVPGFYRWRDSKIATSSNWWSTICENIESCYAFIAVLTPHYIESEFCSEELAYATRLEKPVIALKLEEVDYPEILDNQHLQFAEVSSLEISDVITQIITACYEIRNRYELGHFSKSIDLRPEMRPVVPVVKNQVEASEEDIALSQQIEQVEQFGQLTFEELWEQYNLEKNASRFKIAHDLLDRIDHRQDKPLWLRTDKEREHLTAEAQAQQQRVDEQVRRHEATANYRQLEKLISVSSLVSRVSLWRDFSQQYPEYGDPENIHAKYEFATMLFLLEPFEWCEITAGSVTLTEGRSENDGAYGVNSTVETDRMYIAKYPITNAQYKQFISDGGYQQSRWWTSEAWRLLRTQKWTAHNMRKPEGFVDDLQPVVDVNWYEAVAFCRWLSHKTGEKITLPTEAQWQYAAEGPVGFNYPWGFGWDPKRCHTKMHPDINVQNTAPVQSYEGIGDSPFHVSDMVGNIQEWCINDYTSGQNGIVTGNVRAARGGAWHYTKPELVRSSARLGLNVMKKDRYLGFRICKIIT